MGITAENESSSLRQKIDHLDGAHTQLREFIVTQSCDLYHISLSASELISPKKCRPDCQAVARFAMTTYRVYFRSPSKPDVPLEYLDFLRIEEAAEAFACMQETVGIEVLEWLNPGFAW